MGYLQYVFMCGKLFCLDPYVLQWRRFLEEVRGTELESHAFLSRLRESLVEIESLLVHPELQYGLVHGDVFADNTLFEGERMVAVVDYEVCFLP
jgi:Ser/Thr protein kinase RdoA (MazF antagonist)